MKINEAIIKKIYTLCNERNWSINKLAINSLITQSTLNNIISKNSNNIKIMTLLRICNGCNISLKEFFNEKYFDEIDDE